MQPIYNPDGTYNYKYSLFGSEPSKTLAMMAAGVFILLGLAHIFQCWRFKTKYMIPAIIGAIFEGIGYSTRIIAISTPFSVSMFASQQSLIVISPVCIAASQYMILGKIIEYVDATASPVSHTIIARVFVCSDILSFVIQAAGSGLLVSSPADYLLGTNILIGGLVIQVVSFSAYLIIAAIFYSRASKSNNSGILWKRLFVALYIAGIMVLIRSVFRVVEFAEGFAGPIASNETYLYIFDFALLSVALLAFNIVHPGAALNTVNSGVLPEGTHKVKAVIEMP